MKLIIDIPEETYQATCNGSMLPPDVANVVIGIKNGTQLPTLTDPEQRLFLAAISREERLCKLIDRDTVPGSDVRMLVPLCQNIESKVKEVLF